MSERNASEDERIAALRVIIFHYLSSSKRRHGREKLAETIGVGPKDLNNFLGSASNAHAQLIKVGIEKIVAQDQYYDHAPKYIREAIQTSFDFGSKSTLEDIVDQATSFDRDAISSLASCYSGIWNILQITRNKSTTAAGENNREPGIARTGMAVGAGAKKDDFPVFRIERRPSNPLGGSEISAVSGCVVPLRGGPFMTFIGVEERTIYPFEIRAARLRTPPKSFFGLITRHLERGGIVANKAAFVRSQALSLKELRSRLGLFSATQLKSQKEPELVGLDAALQFLNGDAENGSVRLVL